MLQGVHRLRPPDDPSDEDDRTASPLGGFQSEGEDLPYKVEVWDAAGKYVEQVVAVSISPAIGYAAYYAASREYAGRSITLRHRGRVISRWTGQPH
jgi:hypothetical protein